MAMIDTGDLLETTPTRKPGDFYRDSRGTPMVADPVKKRQDGQPWTVKYGRPSSFGKQIENTYNLEKWNERQIVLGMALAATESSVERQYEQGCWIDGLIDLFPVDQDDREWRSRADGLVVAAKREANAMLAAERGTHTHLTTELDDEGHNWLTRAEHGEDLGLPTNVQAALVDAWRTMLASTGLEVVANEATVVNDRWRVAGTLDRIARLTRDLKFTTAGGEIVRLRAGDHIVLDIKTGKLSADDNGYPRYWHTYAVQVAAYADAVPYNPDTGERDVWPFYVNQTWAVIAHLDVLAALAGEATCTPILVDLDAGRQAGDLCLQAKQWQKRGDLFGRLHEVSVGVVPEAAIPTTPTDEIDQFTIAATGTHISGERPVTITYSRTQLRASLARLIDAGHEDVIRRLWPAGIPPLSQPGHTVEQLTQLFYLVRRVEAEVGAPFDPEPQQIAAGEEVGLDPVSASPAAPLDDGAFLDTREVDTLKARMLALPDDRIVILADIAREAQAAGRPISVQQKPCVRRWEIARALVLWAEGGTSLDHLALGVSAVATRPQIAGNDTVGAVISQFTIEQATRLADSFDRVEAA